MKFHGEYDLSQDCLAKIPLSSWPDDISIIDVEFLDTQRVLPEKSIGILKQSPPQTVLSLALHQRLRHIVQVASPYFAQEIERAAALLQQPSILFREPVELLFYRSQTRLENGVRTSQFPFHRSTEKKAVLGELQAFIHSFEGADTIIDPAILIADELFTNSIYNAPGKPESRARPFQIDAKEKAFIFCAADAQELVIGCYDSFGSLDIDPLLLRLYQGYSRGINPAVDQTSRGAGIGIQLMFHYSSSFVVGLDRNKATMVCCFLPLGKSNRTHETLPKNLHIVEMP